MWCAGPQEHSQPGSINPQIGVGNCTGTGVVPRKVRAMTWVQSVQLLSHVQLCDPMDCSTRGFPVHHQLPELAQTHVCRVGDIIQPSPIFPFPILY